MLVRAFALVALLSSAAAANPITAGVNIGQTQGKADSEAGQDPNGTYGLFGRFGVSKRLSVQVEVTKIKTESDDVSIRTGTALFVLDLVSSGRLVPTIAIGAGIDNASSQYGYADADGHHFEGGVGLEYRADGGFTIGADIRFGGRSIDSESKAVPLANDTIALWAPQTLEDGEYRSMRLYAGIRF